MAFDLQRMINESRQVLTQPSVDTFERFERSGKLQDALIYVALGALISGLFGLSNGISGFLQNILFAVLSFFVSSYIVYFIGNMQGGTGTWDEVAYTFSLFSAPLSVITGLGSLILIVTLIGIIFIPVWLFLMLAANIYFSYLATQSSLNIRDQGKVILIMVLAFIANMLINAILMKIFTHN